MKPAPPLRVVPSRRSCVAFSLLELVIVLGLIAVLMMVIILVSGKVRTHTLRVQSVNNLRQIGIGVHAFAADHQGQLPISRNAYGTTLHIGYTVDSISGVRQLFSSRTVGGAARGVADYLSSPDLLYSPFVRRLAGRERGQFYYPPGHTPQIGNPWIGYYYFSLPSQEHTRPTPRAPIVSGLFNDRMVANPMTPLYSDYCTSADLAAMDFNDSRCHVLYLNGSVGIFEQKEVLLMTNWSQRLRYFSRFDP